MNDLRKASEMALNYFESAYELDSHEIEIRESLRQALAQPEQESFIVDRGCWERGCMAYDWRDKDGVAVYVDAVNMSQERVDETAKREHEPVAWFIQYEYRHEFLWRKPNELEQKTALEIKPLYATPPKREWGGLTRNEVLDIEEMAKHPLEFYRDIEAKLKEKNA